LNPSATWRALLVACVSVVVVSLEYGHPACARNKKYVVSTAVLEASVQQLLQGKAARLKGATGEKPAATASSVVSGTNVVLPYMGFGSTSCQSTPAGLLTKAISVNAQDRQHRLFSCIPRGDSKSLFAKRPRTKLPRIGRFLWKLQPQRGQSSGLEKWMQPRRKVL